MAQTVRRIVTELHDEPHIAGRRVTVRRLQALVEAAGTPAPAVAEEMAAAERKQRARERQAKNAGGRSLAELRDDT